MGVQHVSSTAYTLTLHCKLVSPVSLLYHDNRKSKFHLSSSCSRCCPGERDCSLVITVNVGNSKVILYTASEKGTNIKMVSGHHHIYIQSQLMCVQFDHRK